MLNGGFSGWLDQLRFRIEAGDAAGASELFSPSVEYFDSPFQAPCRSRPELAAFLQNSLADRRGVRFLHDVIQADDAAGWAFWQNSFTRQGTGGPVRMEGILHAEFGEDGLCLRFRQWWHCLEPGQGDLMRDFDA